MTTARPHKQHFLVLDGMRGVAALIIAAMHARELMLPGRITGQSYLAVDFFFCLSGFVVAYAYDGRLSSDMRFATFLKMRFIRLYPMIIGGVMLGGLVLLAGRKYGLLEPAAVTLTSLLLLPGGLVFNRQAYPSNNPVWSLFFEIAANITYALSPRIHIKSFAVLLAVLAAAYAITSLWFNGMQLVGFDTWASFTAGLARVAFPFAAGVFIFRVRWYRHGGVPTWVPLLVLPALLLVPIGSPAITDALITILCMPSLVVLGACTAPPATLFPTLAALGELSYPLYLLHQPILRVVKNVPQIMDLRAVNPLLPPLVGILLAMIASVLAMRLYDRPVRKLLATRWLSGTSKAQR